MGELDFKIPEELSADGRKAAEVIVAKLRERAGKRGKISAGGTDSNPAETFVVPSEWKARGEKYGCESVLVVVHDGGDAAPHFNWSYEQYSLIEAMGEALAKHGMYAEQCTCWYSAVYKSK